MSRILIIYDTRYGQTERIVVTIKQALEDAGHALDVYLIGSLPGSFGLRGYDAVLVAAPVFYGKHPRPIRTFARRFREELNAIPSAFLSVCGSTGREAERYIEGLLRVSGWRPKLTKAVVGGVAYTRYNPLLRWFIRYRGRKSGLPSDTTKDYDFTDWAEVARFARSVQDLVPAAELVIPAPGADDPGTRTPRRPVASVLAPECPPG